MRTTCLRYHYAIGDVKKNEEIMRKEAMAQSISENNSRDLWKEVHKVRDKSKVNSQYMDDVIGNENIAKLFADKYKVLYNSICSNNDQLKELLTVNNTDIESLCPYPIDKVHSLVQNHTHCITVLHVQVAIKKLKAPKSDCTDCLVSDHFIIGTDRFFTLISLIFYMYAIT